jgi:hypothetical protein
MAMKPLREKFIKHFKKTPDSAIRVLPDELAVFFAVMVFEELWGIRELVHMNPNPEVQARHDPIHIFLSSFHQLLARAMPVESPKEVPEEKAKEAPDGNGTNASSEGEGGAARQDPAGPPQGPEAVGGPGAEVRGDGGSDPAPGT